MVSMIVLSWRSSQAIQIHPKEFTPQTIKGPKNTRDAAMMTRRERRRMKKMSARFASVGHGIDVMVLWAAGKGGVGEGSKLLLILAFPSKRG